VQNLRRFPNGEALVIFRVQQFEEGQQNDVGCIPIGLKLGFFGKTGEFLKTIRKA